MGSNERHAIAATHEADGEDVGGELRGEVEQDQSAEHFYRDFIALLEDDEQEGCEVVYDRLRDIADIAGDARVRIGHAASVYAAGAEANRLWCSRLESMRSRARR